MKTCAHVIVGGKVQGVFYRDSAIKQARKLKLTGWVKNRPDGTVELIACGEQSQIDQFLTWLWQGPPLAKVTSVQQETLDWQDFSDFSRH